MPQILIYPGQQGEEVPLLSVLQEAHVAAKAARQAEIAARASAGAPLDDATNWAAVGTMVADLTKAASSADSPAVAKAARELLAATDQNAIEPIGEFVPDPELEGITVQMQVVDDATRRGWNARTQGAWMSIRDALRADDMMVRRAAYERLEDAYASLVAGVIVKIGGIEGMKATVADSMPALRLAGLLVPLHTAARHFLDLPPGKALRCGLQPPST